MMNCTHFARRIFDSLQTAPL